MTTLKIKTCPICGSRRIHRVKRDIPSTRGGTPFVAHDIQIEECPACGEQLFGPEALQQIAAQQPGRHRRTTRRSA